MCSKIYELMNPVRNKMLPRNSDGIPRSESDSNPIRILQTQWKLESGVTNQAVMVTLATTTTMISMATKS